MNSTTRGFERSSLCSQPFLFRPMSGFGFGAHLLGTLQRLFVLFFASLFGGELGLQFL